MNGSKGLKSLFTETGLNDLSSEELKFHSFLELRWNWVLYCCSSKENSSKTRRLRCSWKNWRQWSRAYHCLGAGCADGTCLPPYIVYKGKNLWSRWMQNGPAGCMYSVSDSEWMESANFLQWSEKLFLPSVQHLISTTSVTLEWRLSVTNFSLENNLPTCYSILLELLLFSLMATTLI